MKRLEGKHNRTTQSQINKKEKEKKTKQEVERDVPGMLTYQQLEEGAKNQKKKKKERNPTS